jgi:sporulation protein YlmC with PRC-barrel domain
MKKSEIHLELLIGRKVIAKNGRCVGRIEEIRAERHGRNLLIEEYHIGIYAMLERLSAWSIGRALLGTLRARRGAYRIPWNKLDIANYEPRLLCSVDELELLNEASRK